jgi:hypothetical protein
MFIRDYDLQGLNKGTIVGLSKDAIETLMLNRNDFIQIQLPVDDRSEMSLTPEAPGNIYKRFHMYAKTHTHRLLYFVRMHDFGVSVMQPP